MEKIAKSLNLKLNGLMRSFFRLSEWEKPLLKFYKENQFIQPESEKMK